MPCEFCYESTHTLVSCSKVSAHVDIHRKRVDYGFHIQDYAQFKWWLRNARTPVLKRLVKTYDENMCQSRELLEQVVLKQLYKSVYNYIINEIKKGNKKSFGIPCGLRYYNNALSCFIRYHELFKSRTTPDHFWKMCKNMMKHKQALDAMLQYTVVRDIYDSVGFLNIYTNMESTLKGIHELVTKQKENWEEYVRQKARFVLYRLDFNKDLFRRVMSFV